MGVLHTLYWQPSQILPLAVFCIAALFVPNIGTALALIMFLFQGGTPARKNFANRICSQVVSTLQK